MRIAALITLAVAVPFGVFAVWGLYTKAGRTRFDEMDGLYPLGAGVLSGLLFVAALVMWIVSRFAGSRGG